jgi:4-amino-4-deoxy-L-arabinose transferase-like glycosyltransferase
VAFIVRLVALDQSLWLDEATTAKVVQQFGFTRIINGFSPTDFHPPFYYLFMKLWTNFFGYSEIALRMPSVVFSLLTGYLVYLLGKTIKDEKTGLWSVTFFLFNPLIVYYSQEARMYMMATFLLIAAFYFFIKMLRINNSNTNDQSFLLFIVFLVLSLCTFYGSIFFIVALIFWLLINNKFKYFILTACYLILVMLVFSPLLYLQWQNAQKNLQIVVNWSLVLGKVNLKNLVLIPIKFTSGRISFEPKRLYYFLAGVWMVLAMSFVVKFKNKLLAFCLIFPLLLGFILSFFTPLLQYFRFQYLVVPLILLLVLGTYQNWQRWFLLLGFLAWSLVYLVNPAFHREDWKGLVAKIKTETVYALPTAIDPINYYNPRLKVKDIRSQVPQEKEIFIIPYASEIYGFNYKVKLKQSGYKQSGYHDFRGVSFEAWTKSSIDQTIEL